MQIILGSESPRRKEILSFFSLPFQQIASEFDENSVFFKGDPKLYAIELAKLKASTLAENHPNEIILTADTVVFCEGRLFNKPKSAEEAFEFLSFLSGKWHSVFTALAVINNHKKFSDVEETRILFHSLSPKQIFSYHDKIFFLDKAGGYAIQGTGSIIISRIEGCYYNVMGLPINTCQKLLLNVGIDLWDYLKPF